MKKDVGFASAEEALRVEGAMARIDGETFEERLASPDVRATLDEARELWKCLHGVDPLEARALHGRGSSQQ